MELPDPLRVVCLGVQTPSLLPLRLVLDTVVHLRQLPSCGRLILSKLKRTIKVIVQIPYVDKKNIKLNAYDNIIEILVDRNNELYHRYIDLPPKADISSVSSTYKNGILEMIFKRKTRARAVKTGQE